VNWSTLRKGNGSHVVYEHHYDHRQSGGPLTSDDLSLNATTSAAGFRKPSYRVQACGKNEQTN
jgi:hypothetical protein